MRFRPAQIGALVCLWSIGVYQELVLAESADFQSFRPKNTWSFSLGAEVTKSRGPDSQKYGLELGWQAFDNLSISAGTHYSVAKQEKDELMTGYLGKESVERMIYETSGFSDLFTGVAFTLWSNSRASIAVGNTVSIPTVVQESIPTGYPDVYGTLYNRTSISVNQKIANINTEIDYGAGATYVHRSNSNADVSVGATYKGLRPVEIGLSTSGCSDITGLKKAQTVTITPKMSYAFPDIVRISGSLGVPLFFRNAMQSWVIGVTLGIDLKGKSDGKNSGEKETKKEGSYERVYKRDRT